MSFLRVMIAVDLTLSHSEIVRLVFVVSSSHAVRVWESDGSGGALGDIPKDGREGDKHSCERNKTI